MRKIRPLSIALCLVACLALVACEQAPPPVDIELGPQVNAEGVRRSLVMDSPMLAHLKERQGNPDGLAWYDGRNDQTLSVNAGYETANFQASSTRTRDRQYSSNGRVFDRYHSTSYSTEYRESVR